MSHMMQNQQTRWKVLILAAVMAAPGCHMRSGGVKRPMSATRPTTQPVTAPMRSANAAPPSTSLTPVSETPIASTAETTPTTKPADAAAAAPVPPVTGVVAKKPFVALSNPLRPGPRPSVLLQQHARTDSPVPLALYARQRARALADFKLRPALSADEVQQRLGPPAQLADYGEPWMVYRLVGGRELWLRFAPPHGARLLFADVVTAAEDGFMRTRVFAFDGSR